MRLLSGRFDLSGFQTIHVLGDADILIVPTAVFASIIFLPLFILPMISCFLLDPVK